MIVTRGLGRNATAHINPVVYGMGRWAVVAPPVTEGYQLKGNYFFRNKWMRQYFPRDMVYTVPKPEVVYNIPKRFRPVAVESLESILRPRSVRVNSAEANVVQNASAVFGATSYRLFRAYASQMIESQAIEIPKFAPNYEKLATAILLADMDMDDEEYPWL